MASLIAPTMPSASGARLVNELRRRRSRVKHLAERIQRGLGDRFGEGRMRVDREIDFLDGKLVLTGDAELVDQLRGVGADDVRPEDLPVLRIADDLDEALRLARRPGASVVRKGEASDLVLELL